VSNLRTRICCFVVKHCGFFKRNPKRDKFSYLEKHLLELAVVEAKQCPGERLRLCSALCIIRMRQGCPFMAVHPSRPLRSHSSQYSSLNLYVRWSAETIRGAQRRDLCTSLRNKICLRRAFSRCRRYSVLASRNGIIFQPMNRLFKSIGEAGGSIEMRRQPIDPCHRKDSAVGGRKQSNMVFTPPCNARAPSALPTISQDTIQEF